jgi:hypothetical protein
MTLDKKLEEYFAKVRKIIPKGIFAPCRICEGSEIHTYLGKQCFICTTAPDAAEPELTRGRNEQRNS